MVAIGDLLGRFCRDQKRDRKGRGRHDFMNGMSDIRDLVAPDGFLVTPSHVQIGANRYVRTYVVTQVPSRVAVGWLNDLYDVGDCDVSIYVYPANNRDVIEDLMKKIVQTEAQIMLDQKRGDIRSLTMRRRTADEAMALRDEVQMNLNKVFYVTVVFALAADTVEELERKCRLVESRLGGRAVHVRQAFLEQADGLKSVVPMGVNHLLGVYRNFDLGAATSLFPFVSADFAHEGGVLMGMNLVTGGPVFYNPFVGPPALTNPHMAVIAQSGAGKTTLVKLLTARSAILGVRTVIVDVEGEYGALTERLGGVRVRLSADSPSNVNPFDVEEDEETGQVGLLDKIGDVKGLIGVMLAGQGTGMTPEEAAVVEECIAEEYAVRGITKEAASLYEDYNRFEDGVWAAGRRKKGMPTLSSLYKRLGEKGSATQRLVTLLKPYLRGGSLGLFDGPSEIDFKEAPVITFDLKALDNEFLRPFAMHVVMAWIWERFVKKNPSQPKRVVVEEVWRFMKYKETADFLENMARRARKRKCSLCVATQNFGEFASSQQGIAVVSNVDSLVLMQQNPQQIDLIARVFKLSEGQKDFLRQAGVGQALLRAGRLIAAFQVVAADFEWEFLGEASAGGR